MFTSVRSWIISCGRYARRHPFYVHTTDIAAAKVSGWYTLVIFTASMQEYADPVIDWLDAGRGILGKRFFREVGSAAAGREK
jgi:TFIIF-interacting CTD phosphatase-like protein